MPLKRKGKVAGGVAPVYPRCVPFPPWMVRVSEKFRIPLAILDEWNIEAIMDEIEIHNYTHDVDNPPR